MSQKLMARYLKKLSKNITGSSPRIHRDSVQHRNTVIKSDCAKASKSGLFSLPIELHMCIIGHLDFADVCSVRLISRQGHLLLHSGDVLHHWLHEEKSHISALQLQLYPPPNPITFTYVLEQHHRQNIASQLSIELGLYVQQHVLIYLRIRRPLDPLPDGLDPVWHPEIGSIKPLLLILQHYLESLSHLWLTLPTTPISPPRTFLEEFALQERRIFASYDSAHTLLSAHKLWLFLAWTLSQLLKRPSYIGTIERSFRGWKEAFISDQDFCVYVLATNIHGVLALLRMDTYRERRKAVSAVVKSLEPERSDSWKENWRSLSMRCGDPGPEEMQVVGFLVMEISWADVWTRTAREMLMGQGRANGWREDVGPIGTTKQTVDFLIDVAGYEFITVAGVRLPPNLTAWN